MPIRDINKAQGFVHNIDFIGTLSTEQCNLRALSDVSLYILQNLSELDITFYSRYGTIVSGDQYIPVEPGSSEAVTMGTAIDVIRRDLSDMALEQILIGIQVALQGIQATMAGNSCGCDVGSDPPAQDGSEGGEVPEPFAGTDYDEPSSIVDRKCKAANYIYGGIKTVIDEFDRQNLGGTVGLGVGLVLDIVLSVLGFLVAGPFGALIGAVVGGGLGMASSLLFQELDLSEIAAALASEQDDLVCSLFDATSSSQARTDFLAVLTTAGLTSVQTEFLSYFLTNSLLNLLFFSWGDSDTYIDEATILYDCSGCLSTTWEEVFDFTVSDGGWVTQSSESRDFGTWVTSTGWVSEWGNVGASFDERLYIEKDSNVSPGSVITEIEYTYSISGSCNSAVRKITVQHEEVDINSYSNFACGSDENRVIGPLSLSGDDIQLDLVCNFDASSDGEVEITLTEFIVRGTGPNPFS